MCSLHHRGVQHSCVCSSCQLGEICIMAFSVHKSQRVCSLVCFDMWYCLPTTGKPGLSGESSVCGILKYSIREYVSVAPKHPITGRFNKITHGSLISTRFHFFLDGLCTFFLHFLSFAQLFLFGPNQKAICFLSFRGSLETVQPTMRMKIIIGGCFNVFHRSSSLIVTSLIFRVLIARLMSWCFIVCQQVLIGPGMGNMDWQQGWKLHLHLCIIQTLKGVFAHFKGCCSSLPKSNYYTGVVLWIFFACSSSRAFVITNTDVG